MKIKILKHVGALSMFMVLLSGVHSFGEEKKPENEKLFMVSKYEVSKFNKKNKNYDVKITLLLKVEPGQGVCEITKDSSLVAVNKNGEKILLNLDKLYNKAHPLKKLGILIYEASFDASLPKGTFCIEGDLFVRYGTDLKTIPFTFSKNNTKVTEGMYQFNVSGDGNNESDKMFEQIHVSWTDSTSFYQIRYKNQQDKFVPLDCFYSQVRNSATILTFLTTRKPIEEGSPGEILAWSKFDTKKLPFKLDVSVGITQNSRIHHLPSQKEEEEKLNDEKK